MITTEDLEFSGVFSNESVDDIVELVWFSGGFSGPANYVVKIDFAIEPNRISLYSHDQVLLRVIEPMASSTRDNRSPQLVELDPDHLVGYGVSPLSKSLAPNFDRSSCNPQEQNALILKFVHR